MTPLEHYQKQVALGHIQEDAHQLIIIQKLQHLFQQLIFASKQRVSWKSYFRQPKLVKGMYIWGSVGVGKTFLMDCFFNSIPFSQKMRMHFYQFMQQVHHSLTYHQGETDPLTVIAKEIGSKTILLCFDELFVSDITDAMLLGKLFKALFAEGVTLVATSNVPPDELYKNGLQREQFVPAIDLIKRMTEVVSIASKEDYRLRHLKEAGVFYTPLGPSTEAKMEKIFSKLTQGQEVSAEPIIIEGRKINIKKQAGKTIWFDFSELCKAPRSQQDYLILANQYDTLFVSNIPIIKEHERDRICLFIIMVDVFYDKRVRLVISAEESVPELYSRGYMILEYTRTHSRLLEMQSADYFSGEFNHRS